MKKLGLIGRNIGYSFSRQYFSQKFEKEGLNDFQYENFDIETIEQVKNILSMHNLLGANITIPYKQLIIPYLDALSKEAEKIGAVNTIKMKNGKAIGYNTDAFGFETTLKSHFDERIHLNSKALILGDGGAAKAVHFVLDSMSIPRTTVARKASINFENLDESMVYEHLIIVQCTPVGTFPAVEEVLPFPFDAITENHLVIDLIYNPSETLFMKKCNEKNAKTVNGKEMLIAQAEKAWSIWNE